MMISRISAKQLSRMFSSGGKVLGEEERAAENVYIKKIEREKLEKLARKGPKPEEKAGAPTTAGAGEYASSARGSPTDRVSTDKCQNYAFLAIAAAAIGSAGWYFKSRPKKTADVHD